jgi:PadR family transcriptional regulator PadR
VHLGFGYPIDRHLFLPGSEMIAAAPVDILYVVEQYSYRHTIGVLMEHNQTNLLQGTLDLLILKALGDDEFHGLGISRRIEQITHGTFQVKPGSLFPALHRMEEAGWLKSFWGESENNRRAKFYRRTKAGERQLRIEKKEWETISQAIGNALKAT